MWSVSSRCKSIITLIIIVRWDWLPNEDGLHTKSVGNSLYQLLVHEVSLYDLVDYYWVSVFLTFDLALFWLVELLARFLLSKQRGKPVLQSCYCPTKRQHRSQGRSMCS